MWGANSEDKHQEHPNNTNVEGGQCDKAVHLEAARHIIDVFIFHSERKIMSHVGSTNLHYNLCPERMERTARAQCSVRIPERGKRAFSSQDVCFSIWPRKK